jgi:hypothetical protein
MARFAVINDNKVINVIIADTLEDAVAATGFSCVEDNPEVPAYIGLGWDGVSFEQPPVEDEPIV